MSLAEQVAATAAMRAVFTPRATVQAMLDVEAALAKAGAATGFLTAEAAAGIITACTAQTIDIETLTAEAALAGTIVIPLVKHLRAAVPAHAASIHIGGTSQDIIDAALVLQLRTGTGLLQSDLTAMANAAAALAETYATTPMLARTLLQAALPTTFGLKAAMWLCAITDSRRALTDATAEALRLPYGGAAGTLDGVGDGFIPFITAFGAALELPVPVLPWQTSRAALIRLATAIAAAVGVAGKIGTDIALLMQPEIAEVSEPAAPGRGGSSAMAHKRNPTLAITARAAAIRMPGFIATLLAAQDQEHERAAGAWQAEAATWPALMLCASAAMAAIGEALAGLEIFPAAMQKNLSLIPSSAIAPAVSTLIARALQAHKNVKNTEAT